MTIRTVPGNTDMMKRVVTMKIVTTDFAFSCDPAFVGLLVLEQMTRTHVFAMEVANRGVTWNRIKIKGRIILPWVDVVFNQTGWHTNLEIAKSTPCFPFMNPIPVPTNIITVQSPVESQMPSFLRVEALVRLLRGHCIT